MNYQQQLSAVMDNNQDYENIYPSSVWTLADYKQFFTDIDRCIIRQSPVDVYFIINNNVDDDELICGPHNGGGCGNLGTRQPDNSVMFGCDCVIDYDIIPDDEPDDDEKYVEHLVYLTNTDGVDPAPDFMKCPERITEKSEIIEWIEENECCSIDDIKINATAQQAVNYEIKMTIFKEPPSN